MIEGQLGARKRLPAILAAVFVSSVDVGAGERHVVETALDADAAEQTDNRREFEGEAYASNLPVFVDRDHLHFSLAPQRHRFTPVNDLQWLVRRVQKERLLHDRCLILLEMAENVN